MSNLLKSTFAKNLSGRATQQLSRRGGAFQAVDMYRRMSQASRKGRIFDDVLRHAKLWAEKQKLPADRFESKRIKRGKQQGLF